jgi:serine/threonine protein phosphatase PrpC
MATPCQQFHANPRINPRTRRTISDSGKVYSNLVRECGPPPFSSIYSQTVTPLNLPLSNVNNFSIINNPSIPSNSPVRESSPVGGNYSVRGNQSITNVPSTEQISALAARLQRMEFGKAVAPLGNVLQTITSNVPPQIPQSSTILPPVERINTTPSQVPPPTTISFPIQSTLQSQNITPLYLPPIQFQSSVQGFQPTNTQIPVPINGRTQIPSSLQPTAITSQNISNGCVTSIIGRSGEDRYVTAILNGNIEMYGVFDGHGGYGVAAHLRDNLPMAIARAISGINFNDENDIKNRITNAYIIFDRDMYNSVLVSGSTAVVALYSNGILYLINLGDSRAIVFNNNGTIIGQTHDHKPSEERERIEMAGGNVVNIRGVFRIDGTLAVSRAFGDFGFKHIIPSKEYNPRGPVSVIPDITKYQVQVGTYILLASDGLYDVFTSQIAVDTVIRSGNILNACQELVNQARQRTTDDITVIITQLI